MVCRLQDTPRVLCSRCSSSYTLVDSFFMGGFNLEGLWSIPSEMHSVLLISVSNVYIIYTSLRISWFQSTLCFSIWRLCCVCPCVCHSPKITAVGGPWALGLASSLDLLISNGKGSGKSQRPRLNTTDAKPCGKLETHWFLLCNEAMLIFFFSKENVGNCWWCWCVGPVAAPRGFLLRRPTETSQSWEILEMRTKRFW